MMLLGNMSIKRMEERMGVEFPVELKKVLRKIHQPNASNVEEGKWHCFDMPFTMVCGGKDLAQLVYDNLHPMHDLISTPLNVAVSNYKKDIVK